MSEFTSTVELPGGEELLVIVDYDATYQEARVSGPPEHCYPADGEMTLNSISPIDYDAPEDMPSKAVIRAAIEGAAERLKEEAWEHFHNERAHKFSVKWHQTRG